MPDNQPRLYSAADIAELLDVHPTLVRRLARERQLGTRVGRDWVFTDDDLIRMRERRRVRGRKPKDQVPALEDIERMS